MPTVRIKTAGCDIYPHGSYHTVLDLKDGVYPTLDESDRIPEEWCEVVTPTLQDEMPQFGTLTGTEKDIRDLGYSLNEFRRFGYNSDGSKTYFFYHQEYLHFEEYMKDNNLEFK